MSELGPFSREWPYDETGEPYLMIEVRPPPFVLVSREAPIVVGQRAFLPAGAKFLVMTEDSSASAPTPAPAKTPWAIREVRRIASDFARVNRPQLIHELESGAVTVEEIVAEFEKVLASDHGASVPRAVAAEAPEGDAPAGE